MLFLVELLTDPVRFLRIAEYSASLERQLRMDLAVVQHLAEYLYLALNIRQVLSGELRLNIGQLQIQVSGIPANVKHNPQELSFRANEGFFCVLRPALRLRKSITVNNRRPGIAGRTTAVSVRHTTNGQGGVVQVIHKCLCVGLVQF